MWEPGTNLNLADLKLDDLCIGIEKKDQIEYRFDPDKAAKAILSTGELQLAEWESRIDESDIWVCVENNVWARSGEYQIEKVCDDVAGSRSTGYSLNEVKRRVRNALRDNPIDFDTRNPCLVGTKNGYACNLITGEVRKILPDDYISTELQLPVDYDPNARCPETFKFYDSICITDCERLALLDFDVSALMLKYRREIHQRLGGGANGKGHMQKHQRAFFGTNTIFSITLKEFTDDKFAMQNLFRKRILILPETTRMGDNGKEHSTSAIKSITGGDQQDADVKFKSRIKFVPFCKVVMDANTPPRFDDNSAGWTSRYRRENFPFEFTDTPDPNDPRQKKDDPQILNRITTPEELSGYLNVLLYRAQTVIRDGIVQKCGHLTKGYNEQVFSLEEFIKRFLILDSTKGVADNYYVVPNDLFKKFDRWAELMNGARMKEKSFFNAMTNALGTKAQQFWLEGKNQRVYVGAKFDAAKYETAIDELEEALGHSGYCGNSAETYEDLKTKFAYS
jgi:phage/plasmid-associated DNA primase